MQGRRSPLVHRVSKDRGVKKVTLGWMGEFGVAGEVSPAVVVCSRVSDTGWVASGIWKAKWNAGVCRQIGVCLPTTQDGRRNAMSHVSLSVTERQLIDSPSVVNELKAVT